ncbi:MAG: aminodeoxychorismate/anthranilate synthase component II [Gemmataceae bacterium]
MSFPDFAAVDQLKAAWSDKLVRVRPGVRPELARFEGRVGRVVTVNYGGRAVVDFADGAWYDVPGFETALEEVTDDAERKKYDATANSARSADPAGPKPCYQPDARRGRLTALARASGWYAPMILLIPDNYDSFTYGSSGSGRSTRRCPMQIPATTRSPSPRSDALNPTHIIISPGRVLRRRAGISNEVLTRYAPRVPILGVCLGHQCIGHSFGGEVVRNTRIMHGKVSPIHHDGQGVFAGMSNPFDATRYHSLVIKRETWANPDFDVTAWTAEGEIMGVRHKRWPLHGVQFHPEAS